MKEITYTFVRFFNSCCDSPVDIYIDEKIIASRFEYEDFSKYRNTPSGYHHIKILCHGTQTLLFEKRVNLRPHSCFTLNFSRYPTHDHKYTLLSIEDKRLSLDPSSCFIRIYNTSHIKELADVFIRPKDESELEPIQKAYFSKIIFGNKPYYKSLSPGNKLIEIINGSSPLADSPIKKKLKSGRLYTLYIIGNGTSNYPFKTILSIDGNSYLNV